MQNETPNKVLIKLNFRRFMSDPRIYIKVDNTNIIVNLLAVYVDDITMKNSIAVIIFISLFQYK